MSTPRYNHLVWNRTDLTQALVKQGLGAANFLSYSLAQFPYISPEDEFIATTNGVTAGLSDSYQGETIPPYACMRVITNPVLYKDTICWPVGRPDDSSLNLQEAGLHFFNGPQAIPLNMDQDGVPRGYGWATQDLPAPVLCDLSTQVGSFPYGNLAFQSFTPAATNGLPLNVISSLAGPFSGSWAIHPATDIMALSTANRVTVSGYGGITTQATVTLGLIAYTILGQHPVANRQSPNGASFWYDPYVMWVGEGSTAIVAGNVGFN